jgi:chemosensory pili system protein ChpA (sensor histidine kinase/response regulator)
VAPVLDLAGLMRAPVIAAALTETAIDMAAELAEVLVVDDSLSMRRALSQFLQDSGFRVRLARDGIEAIRAVEERHPDLLIVDLEMPRMNGLELTAHLRGREDSRHLPVIMLTSRSMQKHRTQADLAGVNAYLTKPFQEAELLETVEGVLPPLAARTA